MKNKNILYFPFDLIEVLDHDITSRQISITFSCKGFEDRPEEHLTAIFPLGNFMESLEAEQGSEFYATLNNSMEKDPVFQFLETFTYGDNYDDADLIRLLGEELKTSCINEYDFEKLSPLKQDIYINTLRENENITVPSWYTSMILIEEIKNRHLSIEGWAIVKRNLAA